MRNPISINSISSISPLGSIPNEIWENYTKNAHFLSLRTIGEKEVWGGFLPEDLKTAAAKLREENSKYRNLDDSVLYAILAARQLKLPENLENTGINMGSSRGATALFEEFHAEFLNTGKVPVYTSPSTTLGNISSWLAQDLMVKGPSFSHSITCSTAMHSILNGIAWLEAGLAEHFIVGGSEAPLTPFTIAQMKAMKIYSSEANEFPCKSLDLDKKRNTMVLSEGAGLMSMSKVSSENDLARITGIGYANEELVHGASLSANAECLQKSMKMALNNSGLKSVDAVIFHAPGTKHGDLAEVNAVKQVFSEKLPAFTANKWKIGHSFAASGILSIHMAILMLQKQEFLPVPFSEFQQKPEKLETIMINSVGFGGNAVSIILQK